MHWQLEYSYLWIHMDHGLYTGDSDTLTMAAAAAVALCLYSINEFRERRNQQRLNFRRKELCPNPRVGTPWQQLWASQDRAFITTMGFDVATFRLILEKPGGLAERRETSSIPRNDVSRQANARPQRRLLDGAGGKLILHYYASAMPDVGIQQVFALTPSVLSRYPEFAFTTPLSPCPTP